MKICRALLGITFIFLAMECQVSALPSLATTDIFEDGNGGFFFGVVGATHARVKVEGFKNVQEFDFANTQLLSETQKKSFVRHLFTSDDQYTFFTYALLKIAASGAHESGKYQTQSRATAILSALSANTDMMTAFTSNPNRVIILNRLQSSLDAVSLQRRSSFSGKSPANSPVKTSAAIASLRFSENDISEINKRLNINDKRPHSSWKCNTE